MRNVRLLNKYGVLMMLIKKEYADELIKEGKAKVIEQNPYTIMLLEE